MNARLLLVLLALSLTSPVLADLLDTARETHSDALFVTVGGKVAIDWSSTAEPQLIDTMSVTKSVVALAIGRLVTLGRIRSLDEHVATWFPEWKQGHKRDITLRQLLNHTSGLQNDANAEAEVYPAPDAVQLALAAELSSQPGAEFSYNNKAVNLLTGIIERASGRPADGFMRDELLAPIGITRFEWDRDRAGRPYAMSGLKLTARDLARIGQLVLDRGMCGGTRLIDETFIDAMIAQAQPHYPLSGLLWWRQPATQSLTLKADAPVLASLRGRTFASRRDVRTAVAALLGNDYDATLAARFGAQWLDSLFRWDIGPIVAYYGDGYLGQFLVIVPSKRIVAVRQITHASYKNSADTFAAFPAAIAAWANGAG
jgi:CubicO group peptidase (beta-lactamase class C family)